MSVRCFSGFCPVTSHLGSEDTVDSHRSMIPALLLPGMCLGYCVAWLFDCCSFQLEIRLMMALSSFLDVIFVPWGMLFCQGIEGLLFGTDPEWGSDGQMPIRFIANQGLVECSFSQDGFTRDEWASNWILVFKRPLLICRSLSIKCCVCEIGWLPLWFVIWTVDAPHYRSGCAVGRADHGSRWAVYSTVSGLLWSVTLWLWMRSIYLQNRLRKKVIKYLEDKDKRIYLCSRFGR